MPPTKAKASKSVSFEGSKKDKERQMKNTKTTETVVDAKKQKAEEEEEEEEEEGEEEDVHLQGFSSDSDSSDEEVDAADEPGIDVSTMRSLAKDDATLRKKLEKARKHPSEDRGVIYLGRLPHGFYEDQMRTYFSQFGEVTRLRMARNKKTGRSKHYAFIEFASSEVAEIVSETMNNYLLMGHILQCRIIPKNELHPELWVGANRKWRFVPRNRIAREQQNKLRTAEQQQRSERKLIARQRKQREKILAAGIDYDFEGAGYKRKIESIS